MVKYIVAFVFIMGLIWGFTHIAVSREATLENFTVASCATTTTLALAANAGRISALLVNDGTASIYIKIGEDAVLNEGIRINANGGSYYMTDADGNRDTEVINCIVATGTISLIVTEWSTE